MPKKISAFADIDAIYQKYGHLQFRMGLQHMIMTGSEHFDEENVEQSKQACVDEETKLRAEGKFPVMTAAFQFRIILCAQSAGNKTLY